MSETKYSFINGVPIDPDPSMPDGQKRWEIVPKHDFLIDGDQFTSDGKDWTGKWYAEQYGSGATSFQVVDLHPTVLAFRRPITDLKEAGAGSLEVDDCMCAKCHQSMTLRENSEPTKYCDSCAQGLLEDAELELTQLRTLAKDQGEALEECAKLFDVMDGVVWSEDSDFGPDNYRVAQEATNKAIISKVKGKVGE